MNLIYILKTLGVFGIRICRFSGNAEFQCVSSSIVTNGNSIRIPLDDASYLDVKPDGRTFHFHLSMGEIQPEGSGRYEFGESEKRHFAYKFSDTLVEVLKADGRNGDVVIVPPGPVEPDPIPNGPRYRTVHDKPDWRECLGSAGNGFTRAAHTHKN